MASLAFDSLFVALLLLLAAAAGNGLMRLLRGIAPGVLTSAERGLIATALGVGLLQYLPFGLGMAGLLHPLPLAIAFGTLGIVLLFTGDLPRVVRGLAALFARRQQESPSTEAKSNTLRVWAFLFGAIVLAQLAISLVTVFAPTTDIDGLAYHLNAPKRWLQTGSLAYLPTFIHSNGSMGLQMLFAVALALRDDIAAKLLHFTLGVLALGTLTALARRLLPSAERNTRLLWLLVGMIAAALTLVPIGNTSGIILFGWTYVDLGILFQVLAASLALIAWRQSTDAPAEEHSSQSGLLWVAALCAGFAATMKLTSATLGVAVAVLAALEIRARGGEWRRAAQIGIALFVVSLLPLLPWLWRTYAATGNPLYPMLPGLIPSKDWDARAGKAFSDYFTYYMWGSSFAPYWGLPLRKALRLATLGLIVVLAGAAFWRWRDRRDARLLVALIASQLLVTTVLTGPYARYLWSFLMPLYALAGVGLARGLQRGLWVVRIVAAFLVLVTGFSGMRYLRRNLSELRDDAAFAAGRLSRDAYLERRESMTPIWEYVNGRLPKDNSPILVAGMIPAYVFTGGKAYYSDRYCYVTDWYAQRTFRMDDFATFVDDIRRAGVRYFIVPSTSMRQAALAQPVPSGPDYPPRVNELPFADHLARTEGVLLLQTPLYELYEMKPASASSGTAPGASESPVTP